MHAIQSIDLDQLALVSGGQGRFERLGGNVGHAAGQVVAQALPAPVRPIGNATIPPAGRMLGQYAGRYVDSWLRR